MGGHDCPASNPSVLRTESVERYDPGTDTWTLVSRIKFIKSVKLYCLLLLDCIIKCWT